MLAEHFATLAEEVLLERFIQADSYEQIMVDFF
jgi:hypothetical protein